MKVLLVTTWDTPCGIAEHSCYLKQAVEVVDPSIQFYIGGLDPAEIEQQWGMSQQGTPWFDLLWLNYHAALHSRWTPEIIQRWQRRGVKVGCTYHDTGVPNSDHCKAICAAADAAVVHEPFDDLPEQTRYWRMGVPDWQPAYAVHPFKTSPNQPVLGSIGFPFPWKNYQELAKITAKVGWALFLIAPTATDAQIAEWTALNPHLRVFRDFVPRDEAISLLAGCDATAFGYVCHNTGQSAAILQGIAARKSVFALSTCRQFRALYTDPLGYEAIRWCATFEEIESGLRNCPIERCDTGIVALAEQDSWTKLGRKYSALYREVCA